MIEAEGWALNTKYADIGQEAIKAVEKDNATMIIYQCMNYETKQARMYL